MLIRNFYFVYFSRMRQVCLTGCLCPTAAGGCGWWWTTGPVWPGSPLGRPPRWDAWRSHGPGRSSGCLRPAAPTSTPLSPPELRTSWWQCSPPGLKPKKKKKCMCKWRHEMHRWYMKNTDINYITFLVLCLTWFIVVIITVSRWRSKSTDWACHGS